MLKHCPFDIPEQSPEGRSCRLCYDKIYYFAELCSCELIIFLNQNSGVILKDNGEHISTKKTQHVHTRVYFCYKMGHCGIWAKLAAWGRVTHICVSNLTITGSDNGLSPGRRQAIICTNAGILLIRPLGTNLRELLIEIHSLSFKKMHLKMSSGKWQPFCVGLNVLNINSTNMLEQEKQSADLGILAWKWRVLIVCWSVVETLFYWNAPILSMFSWGPFY